MRPTCVPHEILHVSNGLWRLFSNLSQRSNCGHYQTMLEHSSPLYWRGVMLSSWMADIVCRLFGVRRRWSIMVRLLYRLRSLLGKSLSILFQPSCLYYTYCWSIVLNCCRLSPVSVLRRLTRQKGRTTMSKTCQAGNDYFRSTWDKYTDYFHYFSCFMSHCLRRCRL